MPGLNDLYGQLCESNQILLAERGLVDDNGHIRDWERLSLEQQRQIINQLIENENFNVEGIKKNYLKQKHKAKHIISILILALALLGVGFTLAPLFIVSAITVPILPVLLSAVAIVAITKIFLNIKNNRPEKNVNDSTNVLNQLKECKLVDATVDDQMVRTFNEILEIKNITEHVIGEIAELKESNLSNYSQIIAKLGMFPTVPIPIPQTDPANEFHNQEARSSSPTHN
ncbi:MAG: hypothetical protein RJA83_914 [Pseudomonadota bacterium]|jgi:hypothetical protein